MWHKTKLKLAIVACVPLLFGATALTNGDDEKYTRLSLSGVGYAAQDREFVTLSASTTSFSTDASRAMRDNAEDMNRLRDRLADMGVAKADFQTSQFTLQEASDPNDNGGDRARGFSVQHQLSIVVRDTDATGKVMDAIVNAGARNIQVGNYWGFSGDVSPDKLKEARAEAIRDARTKAQDYASALGMKVRRIVSISDGNGYSRSQPPPAARLDVVARGTTVDARPATILASVGMVFELER